MIAGYLYDFIIIFTFAIIIIAIGNKIKIPGIIGFIITGVLIGPYGLGLIKEPHIVEVLAEIGIIFLLFTIGMQFSFKTLYEMRKIVLIGGSLQVLLTIAATMAISYFFGVTLVQGLFFGFLICHSSTAIALKIYQDRVEMESPQARVTLGVAIFQDIVTIPMLIALPILAGETTDITGALVNLGVTLVVLFGAILVISAYVIPKLMNRITGMRSTEIFLLFIILICFVVTYITASLGLSLALGAFLAGLVLSESDYFNQAFASIIPFRDISTSFFFISIGMLLNLAFLAGNLFIIIGLVIGVLAVKTVIAAGSTLAIGQSLRTSVLAGLALANVGEFAFILSIPGKEYGFFSDSGEQIFLAIAVLTMALTPLFITSGPRVADFCSRMPLGPRIRSGCEPEAGHTVPTLEDHLVIVGYGLNGRHLAQAAEIGGIPHIIIDLNPDTVARERKSGKNIFFGDAANAEILSHATIEKARILVVVINDPASIRTITSLARQMNPGIFIIVRTRFLTEVKRLRDLGADEVIPEEFETSVEIFTRVMKKYLIPDSKIDRFVNEVRSDTYQMLRNPPDNTATLSDLRMNIPNVEINSIVLDAWSPLENKTLGDLNVRKEYSVSILAIKRNGEVLSNPSGDMTLMQGDELIVIGSLDNISRLSKRLQEQEEPG